ncbi:tRNA pseudouridine(38/39) synthase-like isoform X2 [Varroa destructor]|uniref:Pseudouridine synthase I TruA alpha/beta domain-containing protein n=1 Tax=Varroa destructor TaxID=109461 RepID=A0A7M7K2N1_VARDE|nr:tRNA pseudouridine(38/39) synthase-like isoform X2 [Varroa destructor]XP_022660750.1 tRNA pseudouridine(38/39) synthase-like isoform X2 [Varroa destructor]
MMMGIMQMVDLLLAQARTLKKRRSGGSDRFQEDQAQDDDADTAGSPNKKTKQEGKFDFSKYKFRHIALKFLYLGWDYQGLCVQEDNEKTIEAILFNALNRTRLIECREKSNYHRCGRTDKGVSAFCQVISLDVRSNLQHGEGLIMPAVYDSNRAKHTNIELDYVAILNRVLPKEIRVIGWAPVEEKFSARFDCKMRMYRYFFPKGQLKINAMREAASYLVGENDFRNFCKMDVGNGVTEFTRRVEKAWIEAPEGSDGDPSTMCCFCIRANAFLWHQIRCIVAVLVLVGEGNESPSIVAELLDVKKHPRKPQYSLASEVPLCLYEAVYDSVKWVHNRGEISKLMDQLQRTWAMLSIKATMISSMLNDLTTLIGYRPTTHADPLLPGVRPRQYKPLLARPKCETLENRIAYFEKKKQKQMEKNQREAKAKLTEMKPIDISESDLDIPHDGQIDLKPKHIPLL